MESPLQNLDPRPVWRHFDGIRQVPRPSKKEAKIVAHVRSWADHHGFRVREDQAGNLNIEVPATSGHETAPKIILQAHLDMVCEKNAGIVHNFDEDPIQIQIEGDWVRSVGTTLGADNGLGAAAAMAVAVDPEVVHGPLELLLTLDEETGLNGAQALDPSLVDGRVLINLDTEEDDAIYIGCAGAGGLLGEIAVARAGASSGAVRTLAVRGLRGGHSGMDIHENRGNAIRLMARILRQAVAENLVVDLVALEGGSKANAIPRECFAVLRLAAEDQGRFETLLAEQQDQFAGAFGDVEPELKIELLDGVLGTVPESADWAPLASAVRDRILGLLEAVPNGVIAMSEDVSGLVETSNNLAVVQMEHDRLAVQSSMRSSVTPALNELMDSVRQLFERAGAAVRVHRGYPGWKPNPKSPLLETGAVVYRQLFGESPEIKAVHAGLECGILAEKLDGLEAISIGPEIRGAHSPDERARISSVAKFYSLLRSILAVLAEKPSAWPGDRVRMQ